MNPAFPKRSISLFSYTDAQVVAVDDTDAEYGFRRFLARKGSQEFNVAAVWTWKTQDKATNYMQIHAGVARHRKWIQERPTVLLGDFNMDASYRGSGMPSLRCMLDELGLASAYHHFFGEQFGAESRHTYFHRGKQASAYHLDYCFVPTSWLPFVRKVTVEEHEAWAKVSDHVPVIVDLELPG